MQEQEEMLCELWSEEQVEIKQHSRLYHIKPIGVGSPMVESLTSYITRLAEDHSLPLDKLFLQEILLHLNTLKRDYTVPKDLKRFLQISSSMNGVSDMASNQVCALEHLTLRSDIRYLTMLIWADVLPSRGLIRHTRAWCPSCYEEWRLSNQVIYDPLLWALVVVTVCPRHHQRLQLKCPYLDCQHEQFHLTSHYYLGYCTRCHRWLGNFISNKRENQLLENEETSYQKWICKMIGEMFSEAPTLSIFPQRSNLTAMLIESVDKLTGGNFKAFSRLIDCNPKSVWNWTQGHAIPTLGSLMNICFRCGISPFSFLMRDKNQIKTMEINNTCKGMPTRPAKNHYKKVDRVYVQCFLEAVLQNPEISPPSMKEVAERVGHSIHTLKKISPDVCKAISARYLQYLSESHKALIQRNCDKVKQTMLILHAQEIYPSLRQVRKILKNQAIFKEPNVHNAWKEMLKELGLTQ